MPTLLRLMPLLALATTQALAASDPAMSAKAVAGLETYLAKPASNRAALKNESFAAMALSKADAARARQLLWADHKKRIRAERGAEMKAGKLTHDGKIMPFYYKVYGAKPKTGRSLYISMHGGGGAPKRVNDSQWENQKRLYRPAEGVYVAPRAPTDTWNLWHQAHIDPLFTRLIENMIVFEDVDPNRVYLMGYSAGGDGVYQLAPRMADQLAAASMMAGHPNETSPLGLRNLPFSLHVGENDRGYKRNQIAAQWKTKLADLHKADPGGYEHWAKIYAGKGHWMDRQDAAAVPWMAKYKRNRFPDKIVWKQDDVLHSRFYWLAVDAPKARTLVRASRKGQAFTIEQSDGPGLTILLNDEIADLDRPITVSAGKHKLFNKAVKRTIATLARTLAERGDPSMVFSAQVTVSLPARVPAD